MQRLLQVRRAVKRLTDALLDLVPDAQMVGVVALVHVHGDDAVLRARQLDDPVGLRDVQAHRLFGENMDAGLERGQNDLRVQRVGRGHGHHIEVGKRAQDVQPGLLAGKGLGRVARPALEVLPGPAGGLFRARRDCDQLEFDWPQIPRPGVQSDASELRADAGALQVGIRPCMHVPAEHAGADQGNLDCGIHRKAGQASRLSPASACRMCPVSQTDATHFNAERGMQNAESIGDSFRRLPLPSDVLDFRL